jgi:predicted CXXCH cytochrome family protein
MNQDTRSTTTLFALLLLALAISACSAGSSYGVLSFFFDGVPDPNAPELMGPEYKPGTEMRHYTVEERAALQKKRLVQHTVYWHKPYEEKKCNECHKIAIRTKTQQGMGGWMQGLPELTLPKEKLCMKCHEIPQKRFVHGPVATANCAYCHEAHQSRWPHLVKIQSIQELCHRCHEGETFITSTQHEGVSDQACTQCHDPHASEKALFLKPDAGALPERTGPPKTVDK